MILEQKYFVIHRTNDPEIMIHGKEGPRLYLTLKGAQKQAKHWINWDIQYINYPCPNEHIIEMAAEAKRLGPWTVSLLTMTLEKP